MQFKFDCVFYYVSDLDRAVAFYRDVLGLELVSKDHVARFDVDGVLFELVPANHHGAGGNARFCFRVDDAQAAVDMLKSYGVTTSGPTQKPNGTLASFTDPDGNEICLWEYAAYVTAA